MLKLNEMYQSAKKNAGKIVASAVLVGGLVGLFNAYRLSLENVGEEVYRGKINGQEIVYEEGRWNLFETKRDIIANKMTISDGEKTYILLDDENENLINWQKDNQFMYNFDKLENIVIKSPLETIKYDIDEIDNDTVYGRNVNFIFEKMNTIYNDLRTQIREELRNKKDVSSIENKIN